jgi:thiamine-monophosphate kinase
MGVLLGFTLGDEGWDAAFAEGLATTLAAFGVPLLGGDTVSAPVRVLGLTAIGRADGPVPSRTGANSGDQLWVTGTIGDAGAGLKALQGALARSDPLIERYRNPRPRLEAGQRLASIVTAMMDVSDGLLIDAARMASASGCGIDIALDAIPLSDGFIAACGEARIDAATAGDDYELLFAANPASAAALLALAEELGLPFSRVGSCVAGAGLTLSEAGAPVPLPPSLGFEHDRGATNG